MSQTDAVDPEITCPRKLGDANMFVFHADKATKRIIAPYVNIVRRGKKAALAQKDKQLEFFLESKPSVLKRNLNQFLDDSVDLASVMHESIAAMKGSTKSAGARLYIVNEAINEIYICPPHQPDPDYKISWKLEDRTILSSYVATRKEYVMIEDILTDPRFPDGIPYTDPTVKAVLCVPIVTPTNECLAVVELYRDLLQPPYERSDLKIVVVVTGWMGTSIHQNKERMIVQKHQKLNICLMDLSKCYFAGTITLNKMITEIVSFAKGVIDAEKATFYILNPEDMTADVYDECLEGASMLKRQIKANFGKEVTIASTVAKTGEIINIKNATNDFRCKKSPDARTGFIERSILAMPIMGANGVLGVVEVVNKIEEQCFSKTDEKMFHTFTLYCALALYYSKLVEAKQRSDLTHELSLSLMKRHLLPCIHDLEHLKNNLEFEEPLKNVNSFSWYVTTDRMDELPQIVYYMITHVGEIECLESEQLMKFILSVRSFYRNVPYHNWTHAFSVCHCMYNILKRNMDLYTSNERNALLIATLCHDIDHGGITNSFLHISDDIIAQLYPESPWENHHYYTTMLLLGEIPVYRNISNSDYNDITEIIKEAILATDLAMYFRTRAKVAPIILNDQFDWTSTVHRHMLISITMTTCDLSGCCKPFPVAKKIAESLYKEFYRQGDIERNMGYTPLSTMDRERQFYVPEDQVQFLTVLVIPACDLLRKCFPNTSMLYEEACNLKDSWLEVIRIRYEKCWSIQDELCAEALAI